MTQLKEVSDVVKRSCKCTPAVTNTSPFEAAKQALNGCPDCGEDVLISVNFKGGAKK